jgi:hypothetical protein
MEGRSVGWASEAVSRAPKDAQGATQCIRPTVGQFVPKGFWQHATEERLDGQALNMQAARHYSTN